MTNIWPSLRTTSGRAARMVRHTPNRSTSTMCSNSCSSQPMIVPGVPRQEIPALAKATSRRSNLSMVLRTTAFVASASVTSSASGNTRSASNSWAKWSTADCCRSVSTRDAPRAYSSRAVAAPMPPAAPVMSTTLLLRS
ncbi:hypothetical protein D3C73_1361960 [compost metagenome]